MYHVYTECTHKCTHVGPVSMITVHARGRAVSPYKDYVITCPFMAVC